jgi:tetratricopeptide (TPR) repeat protein
MKRVLAAGGLVLSLTLAAAPSEAQMGGARGKVVDREGKPVSDAVISFESRGGIARTYEATTNEKGEYVRLGILQGPYRITVRKQGYQSVAMEQMVAMGEPTDMPPMTLQKAGKDSTVDADVAAELKEKYAKAGELLQAGQLDEAEKLYLEFLEVLPGVGPVHQNLGYIHAQRKEWAKAEEHYLEAMELSPEELSVQHGLISVYRESGQTEKALELATALARENPDDAVAQFNLGVFLNQEGRTEEALRAYEAALAADPGMSEAHFEVGRILLLQDKGSEALEHMEAYLAGNPTNEENKATAEGLVEALKKQ